MTETETSLLLTRIAEVTGRQVEIATIATWHDIIGHLDYEDAVRAMNEHFMSTGDRLMPNHLVALAQKYQEERDREARRLIEQGTVSVTAGKPPWMDEAQAAAYAATEECVARGLTRGHPTTVRSAKAAAHEIQDAWEAEHGAWNVVGRTVVEEEPLW